MQKQITIRGRTYTLRADNGEELENAAAEVDRRIRELAGRAPSFDDYTLALLTALNLASERVALKAQLRERLSDLDRHVAAVEATLEAAIGRTTEEK